MSRTHARLKVTVWSDPEFRGLPGPVQRMYFVLLSQRELSLAGVMPWMPTRLSALAVDSTIDTVEAEVRALAEKRYVYLDEDLEEVLVRTFIRHDGLLASPNMVKAMLGDRRAILSKRLLAVVDDELVTAYREDPGLKGWAVVADREPDLFRHVTGTRP